MAQFHHQLPLDPSMALSPHFIHNFIEIFSVNVATLFSLHHLFSLHPAFLDIFVSGTVIKFCEAFIPAFLRDTIIAVCEHSPQFTVRRHWFCFTTISVLF